MLDPPAEFLEVAREYVCARVTDVSALDLGRFRFDYDLTLAALLLHPDGTVYHRFGGRDHRDATSWTTVSALARVMRLTLEEHARHVPRADAGPQARTVWDLPAFAARVERTAQPCIHCHTLHDAEREQAEAEGRFDRARDVYVWPTPARVGLALDAWDQALVRAVAPGSPAAAAGLAAGDRLLRAGAQRLLTIHDLQHVLHEAAWGPTALALEVERGGAARGATLALPAGWKVEPPEEYAWRPYKWGLWPRPGFGGPALDADEKRALGLDPAAFAFRVQYLVDQGPARASGESAARAGLRRGDVVLALDGRRDFESVDHVHAWFRLTRRPGTAVRVEVLRAGARLELALPALAGPPPR